MKRESFKEVLMRRDGMSEEEAQDQVDIATFELQEIAQWGYYLEAEDYIKSEYGLEPDYLEDLIF